MNNENNSQTKAVIISVVLSMVVLLGWNAFFAPDVAPVTQTEQTETTKAKVEDDVAEGNNSFETANTTKTSETALTELSNKFGSVAIKTPKLTGSISLRGGRIHDLVLNNYKKENTPESENVRLLSPVNSQKKYFVDTGWLLTKSSTNTLTPNSRTIWKTSSKTLTPNNPVVFTWTNRMGVEFRKTYEIDEHYMISIKHDVINKSNRPMEISDYGRIARDKTDSALMNLYILHDGPIGVLNGTLEEHDYDDLVDDKQIETKTTGGWLGFTDQFWLVSLIPNQTTPVTANFRYLSNYGLYQADFKNNLTFVEPGTKYTYEMKIFAGAKEVTVLDDYEEKYNIPMFDKSVDFGWFYFLTKPFFYLLHFLSEVIGNVGVAILAITLLVKIVLFPLANKSYKSMAKMKLVAPRMESLKQQHGDDRQALSQAMMKLYKEEKINPMAGCLPMLIQIPIFFSLYKVLFVTLETRHQPFFGWVTDLSAPDSPGILQGFGLFDYQLPEILMIVNLGIWPILMGISMWAQFKLNPQPSDPIQAKIFTWMPVIFTFMLATFPVGLVIYWTWNNILSMAQQYTIQKRITG